MRSFLLALLVLLSNAAAADKITTDPNSGRAAQALEEKAGDDRLLKKVTVDFHGRLHAVIDELSDKGGISIKCGMNSKDWQVRDIPLVVCATDCPVGKLMRGIADATHLALGSESVEGRVIYRIYRDHARQRALDDYLKAVDKAALDLVGWQWDTLAALSSLPESELAKAGREFVNEHVFLEFGRLVLYGRLMAALGDAGKKQLLSGNPMVLSTSDASQAVSKIVLDICKTSNSIDSWRWMESDEGTFKKGWLILSLGKTPPLKLAAEMARQMEKTSNGSAIMSFEKPVQAAAKYVKDRPEPPKPPDPPNSDYGNMGEIKDCAEAMKQKINLKMPSEGKITWPEVISMVSRQSGYAVVCEDYVSHRTDYSNAYLPGYDNVPLKLALETIERGANLTLRVSPAEKLVIGPAKEWWERQTRLVPESLLVSVQSKMAGPGLELEDALALYRLSEGQRDDWVYDAKDLFLLEFRSWRRLDPIWTLYDSLSPQDKLLAKSEAGLPLARLDPAYVAQVFSASDDIRRTDFASILSRANDAAASSQPLPTDPAGIARLNLCMTSTTRRTLRVQGSNGSLATYANKGILRHEYFPVIRGENFSLKLDSLGTSFPCYTFEREQEVYKALQGQAKQAK